MEMLGRRALWEVGLNYGHGTGHGIGNYFGVHECKTSLLLIGFMNSIMFYRGKKSMVLCKTTPFCQCIGNKTSLKYIIYIHSYL